MAQIIDDLPESELRFHFLSGRPCLDLVATVGERWRRSFERLRSPADLGRWSVEAGLLGRPPRVSAADLAAARGLREAICRVALDEGGSDDVEVINGWAERPDLPTRLAPDGRGLRAREEGTARRLLATVARDAVDLFTGPHADRIRECAADDCALIFVDTSRPGRRRWCSMRGCGNRAKTSAYRRRNADPKESR